MKENIIQAIVAEMQRDLDCRQMARLKAVLASELHNVEIIEKSDCATQQTQENEHLLSSFISAKKIEDVQTKLWLTTAIPLSGYWLRSLWLFATSVQQTFAPIYPIIKKNINQAK